MSYLGDVALPPDGHVTVRPVATASTVLVNDCALCSDGRILHVWLEYDGSDFEVKIGYAPDRFTYTARDGSVVEDRTLISWSDTGDVCTFSLTEIGGDHYLILYFFGDNNGTDDFTIDASITDTPGGTNGALLYVSTDDGDNWDFLANMDPTHGAPSAATIGRHVPPTEIAVSGSNYFAVVPRTNSSRARVHGVYATSLAGAWTAATNINNSGDKLSWSSRNWASINGTFWFSFGENNVVGNRAINVTTTDDLGVNYDALEEYLWGVGGMPTPPAEEGLPHTYANLGAADDTEAIRVYNSDEIAVTSTTVEAGEIGNADWTSERTTWVTDGDPDPPTVKLLGTVVAYLYRNAVYGRPGGWHVGGIWS